jgi:curli biogenesis system outer membrane secretion channel CsgG
MARKLLLVALVAVLVTTSVYAGKPRVAVLEFGHKALNSRWWSSGGAAQDMFITELVKSGKYSVIDRERLEALLREKNLSLGGDVDPSTAVKAGKLLGVEYFLFGNITEFGETENKAQVGWGFGVDVKKKKFVAALDCRLVNTTTGEIIWADTGKKEESNVNVFVFGSGGGVDDDRMFDKVLRPVVEELAKKLNGVSLSSNSRGETASDAKVGKIAKVEGDTVWINLGSAAGLNVGDTFAVYELGEPVKDPDSGEVLGQDEKKVGRIKVAAVKGAKYSECTIIDGSGLSVGNIVK